MSMAPAEPDPSCSLEMWKRPQDHLVPPESCTPEVCPALGCEGPCFSLILPLCCISRPLMPGPSTLPPGLPGPPLQPSSSFHSGSPSSPGCLELFLGTPPLLSCPRPRGVPQRWPGPRLASPSVSEARWRWNMWVLLWFGSLCPSPACL